MNSGEVGQTWLNYLIERKTILWWGGLGNSTEHTAFLRLKDGITAPESGLHRLMEPKATTRPSGSANSRVRANSSQLSRNAPERRLRITDTRTHPSIRFLNSFHHLR